MPRPDRCFAPSFTLSYTLSLSRSLIVLLFSFVCRPWATAASKGKFPPKLPSSKISVTSAVNDPTHNHIHHRKRLPGTSLEGVWHDDETVARSSSPHPWVSAFAVFPLEPRTIFALASCWLSLRRELETETYIYIYTRMYVCMYKNGDPARIALTNGKEAKERDSLSRG